MLKQHNQIGKRTTKEDILAAKVGKTFITPIGKSYSFDYRKEGRKYIYIVIFKGYRMQVDESSFNTMPIDELLDTMEAAI